VLDMLEEQALAANTSLRVAQASLMRARAATAAAEGQHEPDFTTAFGVQRARLSGELSAQHHDPVATLDHHGGRVLSDRPVRADQAQHRGGKADEEATRPPSARSR
jgi:hypothetical protein